MSSVNNLFYAKFIRFLFCCVLFVFVFLGQSKKVFAESCEPLNNQTLQFSYNFNYTVSDGSDDAAGKEIDNVYHWDLPGSKKVSCNCPAGEKYKYVYYTTVSDLPVGHVSGGKTFFTVDDYFEVSSQVFLGGLTQSYEETPLSSFSVQVPHAEGDPCSPTPGTEWSWNDGAKGYLSLYIKKAFIGNIQMPSVTVFDLYANTTSNAGATGVPISRVTMSGTITVPQTCTVNAGQIITVDFGDIWAGKFKTKGLKPEGVNAKSVSFPITCNGGVASTADLSIRFQSTPDANYPDAISSDNPDVGVMITDLIDRTVAPNTGLIPFSLENGQATVSFKAYPVSTTGKAPAEGKFTALAYIRVDFA